MRSTRFLPILVLFVALLVVAAAVAAREERPVLPKLESGTAVLDLNGRRLGLTFSRTVMGPLVSLQPIVGVLGGKLDLGPLKQRHELTVANEPFLFGPASNAVTNKEQIRDLSQPPQVGPAGLEVPLDLLGQIYGSLLGYDFSWRPDQKLLRVARRPPRQIPLVFDVVHLQGVTTLVFQFPATPRYRIHKSGSRVTVEFLGDSLDLASPRLFPADDLVRDVRLMTDKILIDLAPGVAAQDYELQEPFRLVFDVLAEATPSRQALGSQRVPTRRKKDGIRTIVLDPGHGGTDGGARGPGGVSEKELTLLVARALAARLEQRLPVKVVLTRTRDTELPLDSRTAMANQYKADLFISLHVNSAPDSTARGAETYFSSLEASDEEAARSAAQENRGNPLYDLQLILWDLAQSRHMQESQRFAGLVQAELNTALELRNRGVKQAPFRVLLGASMPAVLVELGFLSNPREEAQLVDAGYRTDLVNALTQAVVRYKARIEGTTANEPVEDSPTVSR